jgi:hydrogenase expression/formation protein HypE
LTDPGISVVREALGACRVAKIHAMHDPTEGGVATAIHEMAEAAGVGLRVTEEAIPIYAETRKICRAFALDPLGLLASGALLMAVGPEDRYRVMRAMEQEGIPVAEIGKVTPPEEGVILVRGGTAFPMPIFPRDEVVRALG